MNHESAQLDFKKREIVICVPCGGTGRVPNENRIDDDPVDRECSQCEGSGRMRKEITTVYFPFKKSARSSNHQCIELDVEELQKGGPRA